MSTVGGYTYTEKDISVGPTGIDDFDLSPDNKQLAHTKTIECAWTDRYNIVNTLGNTSTLSPVSNLYALLFHIEPVGKPSGENTWPTARITIGYKNLPYDPTVNKEEIYEAGLYTPDISAKDADGNPAWQFGTTGASGFSGFSGSSGFAERAPTITLGQILYTVVLHNQSDFARNTADGLLNKVNDATFNGWTAGHVLFEGYASNKRTAVTGGVSYENQYRFKYITILWNYEFNPATGLFQEIRTVNGSNRKYDAGNFSGLSLE